MTLENQALHLQIAELEAQLAEARAEAERRNDALESAKWVLKRVGGLQALGYNERHAEDQPNQTDETGTTLAQYRKAAKRLRASIRLARRKVDLALATEAPHA